MRVYIYKCSSVSGRSALTRNQSGTNLSAAHCQNGIWSRSGSLEITETSPDYGDLTAQDIINRLTTDDSYILVKVKISFKEEVKTGNF